MRRTMSAVLIASITELCVADHRDDPDILARWLANKTPEGVGEWFGNPANTLLVAEHDGEIAAAGAFNAVARDHPQLRRRRPIALRASARRCSWRSKSFSAPARRGSAALSRH